MSLFHIYWNGIVEKKLIKLKKDGLIKFLGASVQTPEELIFVLKKNYITHIQIPYNIFDWRWKKMISNILKEKKKRKICIYARSSYLQGLLLNNNTDLFYKANIKNPKKILEWLKATSIKFSNGSTASLCLNYVNSQKWIDYIVVGVESVDQLEENIELLDCLPFTDKQISVIDRDRPKLGVQSLNPAMWRS